MKLPRLKVFNAIFILGLLGSTINAFGDARTSGWCQQGGNVTVTAGIPSTTFVQASFPNCTVTVFLTGTTNLATIFSDNNGTAKSNPFTADTTGYWFFYAVDGKYDVNFSGGSIVNPFTTADISSMDPLFLYPGAGTAVPRSYLSKAADIISVKDFGAKGDGVNMDGPLIQNAVNFGCSLPNGSRIYAPAGTYLLNTSGIVLCSNQEFFGDGPGTVFPVSPNQVFVSPNPVTMAGAGVFMCLSCSNTYLHDVAVINSNSGGTGDSTNGHQRVVSFGYDGTTPGPNNITIQRVRANGMQSENLYVQSAYANKIQFLNNYLTNVGFDGLDFNYVGDPTAGPLTGADNLMDGNIVDVAQNCIEGPIQWTIVTNNRLLNCTANGIIVGTNSNYRSRTIVAHNIIRGNNNGNLASGITIASVGAVFEDNDISKFGQAGISIVCGSGGNSGNNYIHNNTLHNNGTFSGGYNADIAVLGLCGTGQTDIDSNLLYQEGTTGIGILIQGSAQGLFLTNNQITGYTTPINDVFSQAARLNNHFVANAGASINAGMVSGTPIGTMEFNNNSGVGTTLVTMTSAANQGTNKIFQIRNTTPFNLLDFSYNGQSALQLYDPAGTTLRLSAGNGFTNIGTLTSTPISILVNGAETARFTTAGNLALGTTSDAGNRLNVNGNLQVLGNSLFNNQGGVFPTLVSIKGSTSPAQGGSPYLTLLNPSGQIIQQFYYKSSASGVELDEPVSGNSLIMNVGSGFGTFNVGSGSIFSFQQNGVEAMRISASAALLIGTTLNPTSSPLNVSGNINASSYSAATIAGFNGTKTAGSCTIQVIGGIVTSITGC